jgi:hypothetical protein
MRAVVRCPDTDQEFDIEIPTSAADVARYWRKTISAGCPHCAESHLEGFQQLYVQAILDPADRSAVLNGPFRVR